jgi:hypothetical protein
MKSLEWSITAREIIHFPPERVMERWFHPDRVGDDEIMVEASGGSDVSVQVSTQDCVRVRTASFIGRRRWRQDSRTETHLDLDLNGLTPLSGDRFVASSASNIEMQSPSGRMRLGCVSELEFIPTDTEATEVVVTHRHVLVGGTWLYRQQIWKADLESKPREFRDRIRICEAELQASS